MQLTTEARAWLDATVRRILARHPLGEPERMGITYELMSHLHGAGEANAEKAGRTEVSVVDLEAALAAAGGDEALAAAFVLPLAKPVVRVLFWRRFGAYVVDAILLGIALTFVHGVLAVALGHFTDPTAKANGDLDAWGLFPWGFHDPALVLWAQGIIALASGIVVLGYFAWFEAQQGRTLGKRALDLRVMRSDGAPMTYREGILRNLVKLCWPVLVLETLIMVIFQRKAGQRVSDKIAQTIVVRT